VRRCDCNAMSARRAHSSDSRRRPARRRARTGVPTYAESSSSTPSQMSDRVACSAAASSSPRLNVHTAWSAW
jgi:hypothetical protein